MQLGGTPLDPDGTLPILRQNPPPQTWTECPLTWTELPPGPGQKPNPDRTSMDPDRTPGPRLKKPHTQTKPPPPRRGRNPSPGLQAGCTHPSGMLSYFIYFLLQNENGKTMYVV